MIPIIIVIFIFITNIQKWGSHSLQQLLTGAKDIWLAGATFFEQHYSEEHHHIQQGTAGENPSVNALIPAVGLIVSVITHV